jgi:hypothetical protein
MNQEMGSIFRRIADAVGEWFKQTASTLTVPKKFEINSTERQGDSQRSSKNFSITGERSGGGGAGALHEGRFGISGGTRPKQCPRCRTQNSVTRGSGQRWKCKECDFQWS